MSCVFCRIVAREIPAGILYEDEHVVGFRDVNPVAPVHILVVPKVHVPRVDAPEVCELKLGDHIFRAISDITRREGLQESGFRVVSNAGKGGGQTVDHLHFHILAGRSLAWPPG
ncbi:MAG: Purine nucleoside phosphoramidase [Firmicutes bacterium]|nr:Purine nucleoside phosphoramidase [candidate division NPL-UPA2 bacterium]MBT9155209.1 Purine nucleoside phosphoramidase [candidate division NPL-UPA2 bacterium]